MHKGNFRICKIDAQLEMQCIEQPAEKEYEPVIALHVSAAAGYREQEMS